MYRFHELLSEQFLKMGFVCFNPGKYAMTLWPVKCSITIHWCLDDDDGDDIEPVCFKGF